MSRYTLLFALTLVLALVADANAFGVLRSRSSQRIVVKQQVQKVQVQQVVKQQVVKVQQVKVVEQVQVQQVKRVVVQPVQAVAYSYSAAVVQPVAAYYQVQAVQGYGYGSACSAQSAQIRALSQQVEQLQRAEIQRLEVERQRLTMPPAVK